MFAVHLARLLFSSADLVFESLGIFLAHNWGGSIDQHYITDGHPYRWLVLCVCMVLNVSSGKISCDCAPVRFLVRVESDVAPGRHRFDSSNPDPADLASGSRFSYISCVARTVVFSGICVWSVGR
jgi:hypothetical protein